MKRKYYKALSVSGNRFFSVLIDTPGFCTEYKRGTWIRPRIGKVFLFKNKRVAKSFVLPNEVVFECEASGVEYVSREFVKELSERDSFWQRVERGEIKLGKKYDVLQCDWLPAGTVLADKIKLIKEV